MDPRIEGGKINSITKEDIVELMIINNEEYLFYKYPKYQIYWEIQRKIDIAFI